MLEGRGARHLDADMGVRELYARPDFAAQIAGEFGDVLDAAGVVDRIKLGALVFADAEKLLRLEAVVHPAVARLREEQLDELRAQNTQFVIIEAVKLLESGQAQACDEIWCLTTWHRTQVERLMEKRNLSRDEALARLESQPSPEAKRALAGTVPLLFLPNNGTLEHLKKRVDKEWARFVGG